MSINDKFVFNGNEVNVLNIIGDIVVIFTSDGVRAVSASDLEPIKKKSKKKDAVD